MKLFQYELGKRTCIWAQLEERDVAELLTRGGFSAVPCGAEPSPDFIRGNCVVELKCIEEDPLFPNGSLRYIANQKELIDSLVGAGIDREMEFTLKIKADVFLMRAARLIRKVKHQLRANKAQGRITGTLIVNNASYSISGARRAFAAALRRIAKDTGAIDFVILLNVFAQQGTRPRIDLFYLACHEADAVSVEMLRVVDLLKPLPEYIKATGKKQKPEPHRPPRITVRFEHRGSPAAVSAT